MIYITKQKKNVNYSDSDENEESSVGPFTIGSGILGGVAGGIGGFILGRENDLDGESAAILAAAPLGIAGAGVGALGGNLIDRKIKKNKKEREEKLKAFIDSGKIDNEALLEAYKETNKDLTGEIAKGVFDTPVLGHLSRYENWLSNVGSRDQGPGKMPKRVLKQIASAPLALPLGAVWPLTAAHRLLYHENALTTKNIEDSIPGLENDDVKDVDPKLGKLIDSYNSKLFKKENKKYLNWVKKNVAEKYKDIVSSKNGEYKPDITDEELKQYIPGFTEEAIRFVR